MKGILESNVEFAKELFSMVMEYNLEDENNCCTIQYGGHTCWIEIKLSFSKKDTCLYRKISNELGDLGHRNLNEKITIETKKTIINDLKKAFKDSYKKQKKNRK